jgi:RNA polymerase sigma factor (sigma-70 family)
MSPQRTTPKAGVLAARPAQDLGPDPEIWLEQTEVREALAEAISDLPEREKLVVTLYYYAELRLREIGEVTRRHRVARLTAPHDGDPAPEGAPLGHTREPAET